MKSALFVGFAIVLATVAVVCLAFPWRIRSWALRVFDSMPLVPFRAWVKSFMQSSGYIWNLRLSGLVALLMLTLMLLAAFRGARPGV